MPEPTAEPDPTAEHPPIELVAARLRDLRQTALVLSSSPDVVPARDEELRRVAADHDEWLMVAAAQVGLELEPLNGDGTGLPADVRRQVERALTDAGFVLDLA